MSTLDVTPTPKLTLEPQAGLPALPAAGLLALFASAADNAVYTVDSDGAVLLATSLQVYGPISNGNASGPLILNAQGQIVLSRRQ